VGTDGFGWVVGWVWVCICVCFCVSVCVYVTKFLLVYLYVGVGETRLCNNVTHIFIYIIVIAHTYVFMIGG